MVIRRVYTRIFELAMIIKANLLPSNQYDVTLVVYRIHSSLNLDSPNEFAVAEILGSILTDLNLRTGDACTCVNCNFRRYSIRSWA